MPFFVYTVFYNLNAVNKLIVMRIVTLTFVLMFFAASSTEIYSQRCGDGIWLSFKKQGNKFLDSSEIKMSLKTYDRRFKFYNDLNLSILQNDTICDTTTYVTYVNEIKSYITRNDSNKIYFSTACGFYRMEFTFTDPVNGDTMKIIMRKVPHDVPLKLDDIVFKKGEYEFNFYGDLSIFIFKEDKEGIYNFDFSYFRAIGR